MHSGGGLSSQARLKNMIDNKATVLCSTPTYAIRLAEVAQAENIDLSQSHVKKIIVAGEPGGSIPSTRQYIERLWPKAKVFDHYGMTEVGPVSFECPKQPGLLHIIESAYNQNLYRHLRNTSTDCVKKHQPKNSE